jgi:hypothetical protein
MIDIDWRERREFFGIQNEVQLVAYITGEVI